MSQQLPETAGAGRYTCVRHNGTSACPAHFAMPSACRFSRCRLFRLLPDLVLVVGLTCFAGSASAKPTPQYVTLGSGYQFAFYASSDLAGSLSGIERVVVVQHGLQRDGDHYFDTAVKSLAESGADAAHILVIAPQYFEASDHPTPPAGAPLPLWERGGWLQGLLASEGPQISAYAVYDDLLSWLRAPGRAPQLKTIVLAGHSAGGQLMARYSVLNSSDGAARAAGIDLQYIIANPSSYLYFSAARPANPNGSPFSPDTCPDYNQYRYGLEGTVPFGAGQATHDLYARFVARRVTFLFGTADTDPNHRVLDKSCGAEAQGPTRYTRGHGYWQHLHRVFEGTTPGMQAFDVIGVGHDQAGMFGSQCATPILYGAQAHAAADAAACRRVE